MYCAIHKEFDILSNMFIYIVLSIFVVCAFGHDENRWSLMEPEYFVSGRYGYYIPRERAAWLEAASICAANNSRLVNLNDDETRASEIAEHLADTRHEFEDVWIGARLAGNVWKWYSTGSDVQIPKANGEEEEAGGFADLWLQKNQAEPDKDRGCLVLDRKNHKDPILVGLPCHLPRHFICETYIVAGPAALDHTLGTIEVVHEGVVYSFHRQRVTFNAAISSCASLHGGLAVVNNISIADVLHRQMYKARPEFDRAWIGGITDNESWIWLGSGEPINGIVDKFPPWGYRDVPRLGKKCLLLDNHKNYTFVDENCSKKRFFICQRKLSNSASTEGRPHAVRIRDDKAYLFMQGKTTWEKARLSCETNNAVLLSFPNGADHKALFNWIVEEMPELKDEMYHSWLNAKYDANEESWTWKDGSSAVFKKGSETFAEWSDDEQPTNYKCLNMDRRNHNKAVIFGILCDSLEEYICMRDKTENDKEADSPAEAETQTDVQLIEYGGKAYELHYLKIDIEEAKKQCAGNDASAALATFSDMATLRYILDHQLKLDSGLWIGAEYQGSNWQWIGGNSMATTNDGFPPLAYMTPRLGFECLTLEFFEDFQVKFVDQPCNATKYFVCEIEKHPQNKEFPIDSEKIAGRILRDVNEDEMSDYVKGGATKRMPNESHVSEFIEHEITVNKHKKNLIFYKNNATWKDAFYTCRHERKRHLAAVRSAEYVDKLAVFGRILTDMWIGGRLKNKEWEWAATVEKIASTPNADGYPPWETESTDEVRSCLSLSRNVGGKLIFISRDCNEHLPYLCATDMAEHSVKVFAEVKSGNHDYKVFNTSMTWSEAMGVCWEGNSFLAQVDNLDVVNSIAEVMKGNDKVWVGGQASKDGWIWYHTEQNIAVNVSKDPYIWKVSPHNGGHQCLLLKKENTRGMFISDICMAKHPFVCQVDLRNTSTQDITGLRRQSRSMQGKASWTSIPGSLQNGSSKHSLGTKDVSLQKEGSKGHNKTGMIITVQYNQSQYSLHREKVTWYEAQDICLSKGSGLAVVGSLIRAKNIARAAKFSNDLWIGGMKIDNNWVWIHTGQMITNESHYGLISWVKAPYDPMLNCLSIKSHKKMDPFYFPRSCTEYHAFVCESTQDNLEKTKR